MGRAWTACPLAVVAACSSPSSPPMPDGPSAAPMVTIFPTEITVVRTATTQFRADVAANDGVTWELVEGASAGTVTTGSYVAGNVTGTFHVRARSMRDSSVSATAVVHVVDPPVHATFAAAEVTSISGFQGGEMQLVDVDSDGDLDIISAYGGSSPTMYGAVQLLKNDGAGVFSNVTSSALGSVQAMHPRDWAVADFTGDGRTDIAMADHGWDQAPFPGDQSRLLRQTATGTLEDITATAMPTVSSFTHNICAGDLDGDGDQDLVLANLFPATNGGAHMYRNDGTGTFSNVSVPLVDGTFTSCLIFDADNDGDLDVFLGNLQADGKPRDVLLRGDAGVYMPMMDALAPRYADASWSTVDANPVDINRDGWPDLVLAVYDSTITKLGLQVQVNQGNATFADAASLLPGFSSALGVYIWATPADLDGSGWPALVIAGDGTDPRVLVHDGTRFVDSVMTFAGVRRLWPGDIDHDGDIDLVGSGFDDKLYVYRNQRLP